MILLSVCWLNQEKHLIVIEGRIMGIIKSILTRIHNFFSNVSSVIKESTNVPLYKVVNIDQDDEGLYYAIVQKSNSPQIFTFKPEEILENDDLTDSFSPRDVRTLTYLGYLGMNGPRYKILAKRLSDKEHDLIYAIKERGKSGVLIKTAREITSDKDFIKKLDQEDAHDIGFTSGANSQIAEKEAMSKLLKDAQDNKNDVD